MKKASPAPISTPISKTDNMNLPWQTWARETSDFLISATKTLESNKVNYTVNGQICFISVDASFDNGTLSLPYSPLFGKKIIAFVDNAVTPTYYDIVAGSNTVTVASGVNVKISEWYVAKLDT